MPKKITANQFFSAFQRAAKFRETDILKFWDFASDLTSTMMYSEHSVIDLIAESLELKAYTEYYSIDAVLFSPEDLVPIAPTKQHWFRRIRMAFEHENNFRSGLFQEFSHLMITNCDLRVVVSYPAYQEDIHSELKKLHRMISETDKSQQFANEQSILFIIGWEFQNQVLWFGSTYQTNDWQLILPDGFSDLLESWKNIKLDKYVFSIVEKQSEIESTE